MLSVLDLIGHLSNALYTIGSGFRNILYLRWAFVLAATTEIIYDGLISDKPMWTPILWSIALIVINIYQILRVFYKKKYLNFSEDELQAFVMIGSRMDVLNFEKIMHAGAWQEFPANETIIKENESGEKVYLLVEGEADVKVEGKKIASIRKGNFIGEMSFITGHPSSAEVSTAVPTKLIGWKKDKLTVLMKKSHTLQHEIQSLFGHDMVGKLNQLNKKGNL